MARQEIKYICEICGKNFSEKEQAEQCEKEHYKVEEITQIKYEQLDNKRKLPSSILVRVKNSEGKEKIVEYNRKL